jgi:DNA helicase-2/ATP-dependent DNA helicase PcrA
MPYGSSGNSYGGYGYSATNKYQKKDNYNQDVYNDDFSQKNSSAHRKGQKVFHKKFGYGKILAIDNNKLEISFSEVGIKKIMADFIEVA